MVRCLTHHFALAFRSTIELVEASRKFNRILAFRVTAESRSYLPALAPWLLRFIRAGTPEKARAAARALRPLVGPTLEALQPQPRRSG
jgi:hypothetical protein